MGRILLLILHVIISVIMLEMFGTVTGSEIVEPSDRNTVRNMMKWKIHDLTQVIVKDVKLKLRHATRVQEKYRGMISYELGTIASSIYDKFKHMLEVYRKYSNLTDHRTNKYYVAEIFNAYHIIKGDFNEIRMKKNMYYEVVAKHMKKREQMNRIKNKLQSLLDLFKPQRMGDNMPIARSGHGDLNKEIALQQEEDFKRSLRIKKWAEKWNNFIPEVEGVDIDEAAIPKF